MWFEVSGQHGFASIGSKPMVSCSWCQNKLRWPRWSIGLWDLWTRWQV